MCVTSVNWPLGNLTLLEMTVVMIAKKDVELTICFVALVSIIQSLKRCGLIATLLDIWMAEKIENLVYKEEDTEEREIEEPFMFEKSWSLLEDTEPTWLTVGRSWESLGLSIANNCWHCSWVMERGTESCDGKSWDWIDSWTWLTAWELTFLDL